MGELLIYNGRLLTQERQIDGGAVLLREGRIARVYEEKPEDLPPDTEYLDAEGRYIAPGFVDIHVHGGGGTEFMCDTSEEAETVCMTHLRHGTTSIVPTTSSAARQAFLRSMDSINRAARQMAHGPEILGIHMEGPYFADNQRGAQDPRHVRNPDPAEYLPILEQYPNIIRWSLAPELPGALEMAADLWKRGVQLSIGHSDALYEEAVRAYENGFTSITHFYSCTSTVRRINAYRHAGIVEAGYQLDDLYVEVIADGRHLPASLLKLIYKIKGADRICLVTDAVSPAGLAEVPNKLYSRTCGTDVIVEDAVAKLPDRSAFAGSVATADRLVRTMHQLADVPMREAVKMMSATPAKCIGVFDRKGSIAEGKDGDIVLFDDQVSVSAVIVRGERVV
ncbi:MAG: N-acetylglucosamine-6-phosphate deacetylase [Oscillibacter sp.]|jgi:N-acetylglucosamine-6-phosphate deacetylase|nr:N-acetylglucosamine-6-phosphate deacetylase [Oscillibacter sp.]